MGKKWIKYFPRTKAKTAEARLEQLVKSKSITGYLPIGKDGPMDKLDVRTNPEYDDVVGSRKYPDGFEAVIYHDSGCHGVSGGYKGALHVKKLDSIVFYDLPEQFK